MLYLAGSVECGLGVHEEGNNQTIETQDFGENENKNHADEESGLLSGAADTGITDDTNRKTSSETSETNGKTGAKLDEACVECIAFLAETVGDQN